MALLLIASLISCEKEVLDGEITIRFALGNGAYGVDEMRETGLEEMDLESETVVVPVEGVLHMYATLEEEESPLRAAGDEVMEIGTKIIIAAYDEDGAYVDEAEYEVTDTSGGIKPTDVSERGLTIATTGDYTFVAYSLNTTSPFIYSDNMGPYLPDNLDHDPLWGASPKVTVFAGMNRVNIEMRHVFSRVTLKVSSTELTGAPLIADLSAVLMGYEAMIRDGALGKGADLEQEFEFPAFDLSEIVSERRIVYAGNENVTVFKFSSVEIGATTRPELMAWFDKKLLPGRSYILRIAFDELAWAASNIYWDSVNERLTFDREVTETPYNQGYQGVYFRWGSLVGISPAGTFSNSTPLYVPYGYPADPKWKKTTRDQISGDNTIPYANNWTSWTSASGGSSAPVNDIPYMDGSYPKSGESINYSNNTYLIDAERNDVATYQGLRGDICQYLSTKTGVVTGKYRLPSMAELRVGVSNGTGWNGRTDGWASGGSFGTNTTLTNSLTADGKTVIVKGTFPSDRGYAVNNIMGGLVVPASGYRAGSGGAPNWVGNDGLYWSGSASSATNNYMLRFRGSDMTVNYSENRGFGLPVRCVKN
jgi:hypothetical protein